jgi:hypothetical protein
MRCVKIQVSHCYSSSFLAAGKTEFNHSSTTDSRQYFVRPILFGAGNFPARTQFSMVWGVTPTFLAASFALITLSTLNA